MVCIQNNRATPFTTLTFTATVLTGEIVSCKDRQPPYFILHRFSDAMGEGRFLIRIVLATRNRAIFGVFNAIRSNIKGLSAQHIVTEKRHFAALPAVILFLGTPATKLCARCLRNLWALFCTFTHFALGFF